jgi:hypothetical protein
VQSLQDRSTPGRWKAGSRLKGPGHGEKSGRAASAEGREEQQDHGDPTISRLLDSIFRKLGN